MWVAFDDDNVYVAVRCWESESDRMVANEMRRDGPNMWQGNDLVAFSFDTFHDRRNCVQFHHQCPRRREDGQVTNERQWNGDWNTVWDVEAGRFEGGWTVEAAIPFKSLRYQPGRAQIWGFNAFRINRWKNEISYITRVPAARGSRALSGIGRRDTCRPGGAVRLENLELKPYAISGLTTDRVRTPAVSNDLTGDIGLDAKYGLTQNLTADFTYNTDFAQVEADEQQVNLTRFSLFFPEKREFFLENQGMFAFGGVAADGTTAAATCRSCSTAGGSASMTAGRSRSWPAAGTPDVSAATASDSLDIQTGTTMSGRAVDEFLRRAPEARHVPPQQRRADPDRPIRRASGTAQRRLRHRRHVRVLRQPERQYVLGAHAHQRPRGNDASYRASARLPGRPLRRPTRAPRRRRQFQSGSRLRAARRYAPKLGPLRFSPRSNPIQVGPEVFLAGSIDVHRPTELDTWRRASRRASSRSSSRTPIDSASTSPTATSSCRTRSPLRQASRCRSAAIEFATCTSR